MTQNLETPRKAGVSRLLMAGLACLWLLALGVSTHAAVAPLRASLALLRGDVFDKLLNTKESPLELKRSIQSHYLSYGVYIPLDDIVVHAQEKDILRPLLDKACGSGRAAVWVPFKFSIPIAGEKVFEWCLVKV